MTISVIITTRNEEQHITDCITSAQLLTKDVRVLDMHSTDATVEKAKQAGAQIELFPFTQYVEPARQHSIESSKTDWIFILDADERITKELANEIHNTIEKTDKTHFKVPRKNIFGHSTWLEHGGWWPDYQLRLIKKEAFLEWPARIHATPTIKGDFGWLRNPLVHYFHGDLEKMVEKTTVFEDIESELLYKANRSVDTKTFFRKYFGELNRRLVKNKGFLDGKIGIMESIYQAFSKTVTYLYLYEKKNRRSL